MMFDSVIADTVQRSYENILIDKSDYIGDGSKTLYRDGEVSRDGDGNPLTDEGLIYCGTCHELKQYRIYSSILRRVIEPFVLCKCGQKIDKQERDRIIEENRQRRIAQNLSQADSLMLKNTFDKDKLPDSSVSKLCRDYCRRWNYYYQQKNIGLYIYGGVGVGKTFYASCVANEIAKVYGNTVKALSVTKAINDLFSNEDKSGYIDQLAAVDLLVLDDFGAERKTDYAVEQLFSIIDERYKAQKPIIITSNLDYGDLKSKTNIQYQRIYDRVIDMCIPVKVDGQSMRGQGFVNTQPSVYSVETASFDVNKFENESAFD